MEVGMAVVCERYREAMMAFLDDELPEVEKPDLETHLQNCPCCNHEFRSYQKLNTLACQCQFMCPGDVVSQEYWTRVCRKMEQRAAWTHWAAGAILLLLIGNLMIFGSAHNALMLLLGTLALVAGVSLLWMSYYCNCK
jgi:predicted anti-sigma-YlaC factor YlaD